MKKYLLLILTLIFINIPTFAADVTPYYVANISTESRGVYQAPKEFKIYKTPNENSPVVLQCSWDYTSFNCPKTSMSNLFIVFVQLKELAFLTAIDDYGDWIEVLYDRNSNLKGWVKKDENDPYRFLTWRTFYNLYGRKYGIYLLKDVPQEIKNLHTSTSEDSQVTGQIDNPSKIKMQSIKGNWMLVNVFDSDKTTKTGYLQWRNIRGEIYAFPAISKEINNRH